LTLVDKGGRPVPRTARYSELPKGLGGIPTDILAAGRYGRGHGRTKYPAGVKPRYARLAIHR
jgi:hypothetical protein